MRDIMNGTKMKNQFSLFFSLQMFAMNVMDDDWSAWYEWRKRIFQAHSKSNLRTRIWLPIETWIKEQQPNKAKNMKYARSSWFFLQDMIFSQRVYQFIDSIFIPFPFIARVLTGSLSKHFVLSLQKQKLYLTMTQKAEFLTGWRWWWWWWESMSRKKKEGTTVVFSFICMPVILESPKEE